MGVKATASTTQPAGVTRSIRFRWRRPPRRIERIEGGAPANVDLRSQADRHLIIVDRDNRRLSRALQRLLRRRVLARRLRRLLRPDEKRPPARRLDIRRRRGPGDSPGTRAVRRGVRRGRDQPCFSRHGSRDQRARLPGVSLCWLQLAGIADGSPASAQARRRSLPLPGGGTEDLPRNEAIRPDRGGEWLGRVCAQHGRFPLRTTRC